MLKIKLSRIGKKNQPFYRIIIDEAKSTRNGEYFDLIGTYNPMTDPKEIKIDVKKYNEWLAKGAKPTQTVASIYKKLTLKK